ncbi:Reverse transcriptase-like protein [Rhynchospora pubera]|uniref:Reverse transcriptase-like protein n=1 Tax=Rhynchospora pubera TaxID=906938 RepID=A0AAV8DDZ4_9POAL|nr:Reverse transcriptase-like protein [Rhynchospora pubera]
MFLWKLLHDAIPVKALIARRMRTQPPPCEVCGLDVDGAMHVLFLCIKAKQCWLASGLGLRVDSLHPDIIQAVMFIFQQLDTEQLVLFANIIWSIWKTRCKEVYEGKKMVVRQILRDAGLLNNLTKSFYQVSVIRRGSLPTAPSPPIQLLLDTGKHCKMDGSFKEGSRAGWAYTLYENNVLIQYGLGTGDATSPLHAELLALNNTIQAALSQGWQEATFYTDCEVIAKVLNGVLPPEAVDWRVYILLLDTISTLKHYRKFVCCYAPRDLLVQEHNLANFARIGDLTAIGHTFPLFRPL